MNTPTPTSQSTPRLLTHVTHLQPAGGAAWWLASLLPPSAISLYAFALVSWESAGVGITRSTLFSSLTPSYFSVACIVGMLLFDVALYWSLMLLLDRLTTQPNSNHTHTRWAILNRKKCRAKAPRRGGQTSAFSKTRAFMTRMTHLAV